jgi:hypothetical protein
MWRAPKLNHLHNANIDLYRRLIAESERNPKRDEDRHKMLLTLLDEETAKDSRLRLQIERPNLIWRK